MCVAYILIIPFVRLYTYGVTDIEYIYKELPFFFCMVQLLSWSRYVAGNMTGFSGYAKLASKISVAEAVINITLSVIFVNLFGITGILLGTVMALPLKVIILNFVAEKRVLKRKKGKTAKILIINYSIFGLTIVINNFLNLQYSSYIQLAASGAVLTVIYGIVVFSVNSVVNRDLLSETLKQFRKKIAR
jgi:O-antigen/teichoic acid export membrane protein